MRDISPVIERLKIDPTDEDWWVFADWLAEHDDPWAEVVAAGVGGREDLTAFLAGPRHVARFGPLVSVYDVGKGAKLRWSRQGVWAQHGSFQLDELDELVDGPPAATTRFRFLGTSWRGDPRRLPPAIGLVSIFGWRGASLDALVGLPVHRLSLSRWIGPSPSPLLDLGLLPRVGPLTHLTLHLPVRGLEPLVDVPSLRTLHVDRRTGTSLAPLRRVPGLRSLAADELVDPADVATVSQLEGLRGLEVHRSRVDLEPLRALGDLEQFAFDASSQSLLDAFPRLRDARQYGVAAPDLTHFASAPELRRLAVIDSPLDSLDGLEALVHLRALRIDTCGPPVDLAPLAGLSELERLEIRRCRHVSDLAPLAGLTRLRHLVLEHVGDKPVDLTPLFELPSLQSVRVVSVRGAPTLLSIDDLDRHRPLRFRRH